MAESNEISENNVFSANDPLDINELASLNEEISSDFIEQLQNKISVNSNIKNDGDLFEEPSEEKKTVATFNNDIDDNFIKKYKAKLYKKSNKDEPEADMPHQGKEEEEEERQEEGKLSPVPPASSSQNETITTEEIQTQDNERTEEPEKTQAEKVENDAEIQPADDSIEKVSGGNIIEKPIDKTAIEYNESLDYLDNNIKYSKYVIYIDPENKDFIDSLTVKERKNLINRIIREQDSIAIAKHKLGKIQTIITHAIVAILTIVIAIPCIYWTINASLEATINNYRASQTIFGQLYKEHGKIKTNSSTHKR